MPSYIVKPDKDVDFYVYWNEVVESPTLWGSREEFLREYPKVEKRDIPDVNVRMNRADRYGCSALWPSMEAPIYGYKLDDGPVFQQKGSVSRVNLPELCRRLGLEADPDVSDLLEPFED